jgi:hypothetical protein
MLEFSTKSCDLYSPLLSGYYSPPPPFLLSKYSINRQFVAGGAGGVESCWRPKQIFDNEAFRHQRQIAQ